ESSEPSPSRTSSSRSSYQASVNRGGPEPSSSPPRNGDNPSQNGDNPNSFIDSVITRFAPEFGIPPGVTETQIQAAPSNPNAAATAGDGDNDTLARLAARA